MKQDLNGGLNPFVLAAILLRSLKMQYKEVKRCILEVDESKLTVAMLEQLIKFMPEPDTLAQMADLKDQYEDLAESEQFLVEVKQKLVLSKYSLNRYVSFIIMVSYGRAQHRF